MADSIIRCKFWYALIYGGQSIAKKALLGFSFIIFLLAYAVGPDKSVNMQWVGNLPTTAPSFIVFFPNM